MTALPVTSFYAALFALMLLVLSMLVGKARHAAKVSIGLGDDIRLLRASRAHGNFVEYVPMILILMLLLEASGASAFLLNVLGTFALAGRIAHALGISQEPEKRKLRQLGMAFTVGLLVSAPLVLLGRTLF